MQKTYLTIIAGIVALCSACTPPTSDINTLHSQSFAPPAEASISSGTWIATWQGGNDLLVVSWSSLITATNEMTFHDIALSRLDTQLNIPQEIECDAIIQTPTHSWSQLTLLYHIRQCIPRKKIFDQQLLTALDNRSTQRYHTRRDIINPDSILSWIIYHSISDNNEYTSIYPADKQRHLTDHHPITRTHTGAHHHETIAVSAGSFEWYQRVKSHITQLTLHTSPKKYKIHYQYKVWLDSSSWLSIQGDRTPKNGRQGTITIPTHLISHYNNLPLTIQRTLAPSLSSR